MRALWLELSSEGLPCRVGKDWEVFASKESVVPVSRASLITGDGFMGAGMARIYGATTPRGWLPLWGFPPVAENSLYLESIC